MFQEDRPIYHQIADRIKSEILTGALGGDDKLMSTNEYATFYRINPATAGKAFHLLLDEGLIYKRRGVGMFVSPEARQIIRARRRDRFFEDVIDPMVEEALTIGIPIEHVIHRIRQRAEEGPKP